MSDDEKYINAIISQVKSYSNERLEIEINNVSKSDFGIYSPFKDNQILADTLKHNYLKEKNRRDSLLDGSCFDEVIWLSRLAPNLSEEALNDAISRYCIGYLYEKCLEKFEREDMNRISEIFLNEKEKRKEKRKKVVKK